MNTGLNIALGVFVNLAAFALGMKFVIETFADFILLIKRDESGKVIAVIIKRRSPRDAEESVSNE